MIRRTESHLAVTGGRSLFRRAWLAPQPERVVVLVHGYAEHSGRYERMGSWLAARACAVHAYDQQGHGRSSGARGHVRRFADLLDDLDLVVARSTDEHPGLPVFAVGHSMGGLVVASWAGTRNPEVAGVVTSGAALRMDATPSRGERLLLGMLRRVVPGLARRLAIDPETLSRDPDVRRAYVEDPLVFSRMTFSLAAELFEACGRAPGLASQVRVPMLLLHGGDDRLCAPGGSREFFERLAAPGCELRIHPGLRHEIFNEPEQEQVFGDLLQWVQKREVAGA